MRIAQRSPQSTKPALLKGQSGFSRVELTGFEPQVVPAEKRSELQVRSVSFQFNPARYLRFRFRILTASRAADSVRSLINAVASTASMWASRLLWAALVDSDMPERHVQSEFDRSGRAHGLRH